MSKHSKALRELFRVVESGIPCQARYRDKLWAESHAAADHMKSLERELRIARKALRYIQEQSARPGCQTGANPWDAAKQALAAMRQARRKQ